MLFDVDKLISNNETHLRHRSVDLENKILNFLDLQI